MFNKGIITQPELTDRIREHEFWLKNPQTGKRFQASRIDFIGMDFKGDLSGAMADNCDFSFTNWKDVRIDGATFDSCDFSHANFSGLRAAPKKTTTLVDCNFERSEIQNSQFYDARLSDLNFSNAKLSNVTFNNCTSKTLSFRAASWNFGGFVNGEVDVLDFTLTVFDEIVIAGCTVYRMNAPSFDFSLIKSFKGSKLLQCDFSNAKAEGLTFGDGPNAPMGLNSIAASKFENASLSNCFFKDIEVYRCDFSSATVTDATFTGLDLIGGSFSGVEGNRLTLTDCFAYKVSFKGAQGGNWYLSNCELSRADFADSNLSSSQLEYNDLTGAKFLAASVDTISFTGSELDGAVWVTGQRCKVGSKGRCEIPL